MSKYIKMNKKELTEARNEKINNLIRYIQDNIMDDCDGWNTDKSLDFIFNVVQKATTFIFASSATAVSVEKLEGKLLEDFIKCAGEQFMEDLKNSFEAIEFIC